MFDERLLGLSPAMVQEMFRIIVRLNQTLQLTVVLVEQNVVVSLQLSQRACVLENGEAVMSGEGRALLHHDRVRKAYLGL